MGNVLSNLGTLVQDAAKGYSTGKIQDADTKAKPDDESEAPIKRLGEGIEKGVKAVAHKLNPQYGHTPYSLARNARLGSPTQGVDSNPNDSSTEDA